MLRWSNLLPFDRFSSLASIEQDCRKSFHCLAVACVETCMQSKRKFPNVNIVSKKAIIREKKQQHQKIEWNWWPILHFFFAMKIKRKKEIKNGTYRTDNLTRIFSIVADCPCDVKSMMTSQRASGNGVNCPCTVGVTIQSSISPEKWKQFRLYQSIR